MIDINLQKIKTSRSEKAQAPIRSASDNPVSDRRVEDHRVLILPNFGDSVRRPDYRPLDHGVM